uniref:tRNA/rRNA methyltransferase SpoU type domain-containing protein n=1 Tax=Araucaria cunninghamii TaxID=56994 RepID=A0A0D6R0H5_ARACU
MEKKSLVIVHNVAKRHNIGTLARSATAFGVSELILVGRKDFNSFGSHGSALHLSFRHFYTLEQARQYLKDEDCDICGVEIADGAFAVHEQPFRKSTAFLLGNEGTGLSSKEMEICDFFVYISQYGCGTASLNVTIAASIVLHHFAVWAGFPERRRDGQKFVVAEKPVRQVRRNFCAEPLEVIVKERTEKKELGSYDWLNEGVIERNEELKEKTEDSFSCMPENKNETTTLSMLFDSDL